MAKTGAPRSPWVEGGSFAVVAAVLFGATMPWLKRAGAGVGPFWTAAALYVGAATIASLSLPPPGRARRDAPLRLRHVPRVALVASLGAFVAPALLAWGLARSSGAPASLLLNLEAAFTIALGALLHREHVGGRVALAAASIGAGGAVLVLSRGTGGGAALLPLGAVALATFAWSADNALGRPLADLEPNAVVAAKSALGAALSFALAAATGDAPPRDVATALSLAACGAAGYGLSLRFYLLAQRRLGAGRAASLFGIAPFFGAALSGALGEPLGGAPTAIAAALMAFGAWLHVGERHEHAHTHARLTHEHAHTHDDEHHAHAHEPMPEGPHSHVHAHEPLAHAHPHAPDLHHRHAHRDDEA
jgi:drug/metabolite transporter (DMT)-like permease